MRPYYRLLLPLLLSVTASLSFAAEVTRSPTNRPAAWAEPLTLAGVSNFHKVSPQLYRGAQPTAEGMRNLKAMGIKTVVNLRSFHSDRDELKGTELGYEHLTMKAWHPEWKEAVAFLKIVSDPARTPVFVHCLHGADRTGTMCALYRVTVQNWPRDEAVREMTQGGFNFHEVFDNLPDWLQALDLQALRREAGLNREAAANEK